MGKIKYFSSVSTGVLECLTAAGIIFGWSNLRLVLQKEKFFYDSSSCNSVDGADYENCITEAENAQEASFNKVYTVASLLLGCSILPNGLIFDNFGTLATRILASTLFLAGCLVLAFATVEQSFLIYIAMICICVGGIMFLVTNFQTGNLFPKRRSSIIALISGSLDSSSAVCLFIKLAYDAGYSLKSIFLVYSSLTAYQLLRFVFFLLFQAKCRLFNQIYNRTTVVDTYLVTSS